MAAGKSLSGSHVKLVAVVTVAVIAAAWMWLSSLQPLYRVGATVEVVVTGPRGVETDAVVETQVRKLTSGKLLRSVIDRSKTDIAPDELERRLRVDREGRSNIIDISYCSSDAAGVRRVLTTLVQLANIDAKLSQKSPAVDTAGGIAAVIPQDIRHDDTNRSDANGSDMNQQLLALVRDERIVLAKAAQLLGKRERGEIILRFVDRPEVRSDLSTFRAVIILFIALLGGVALGFAAAWVARWAGRHIASPRDITGQVDIPYLGDIPHKAQLHDSVLVIDEPASHYSDSFFEIKEQLAYMLHEEGTRVIGVTSLEDGVGKSTVCVNLAALYSRLGHRVIILDLDMLPSPKEKVWLHQKLHLSNDTGMSEVLAHKVTIASAIQHSAYENLDVVSSGKLPPNPKMLLSGERMDDVIDKLRTVYDIIILDMPSIGLEAYYPFSRSCDVSLFVMRAKKTPKTHLETIDRFYRERVGTISCALVLNDLHYPKSRNPLKKGEGEAALPRTGEEDEETP